MIEEEKEQNDVSAETTRNDEREEIFSKAVRAGKRTYFFDVKATKKNDYYLTITESKKRFNRNGRYFFEKHKIFLYKEDFDKFEEAYKEIIAFIKENNPYVEEPNENMDTASFEPQQTENKKEEKVQNSFTDVEFEDLNEVSVSAEGESEQD